MVAEVISST